MLTLLLSTDYAIFTVALVIMLGIGTIEALGLGLGHVAPDAGVDLDSPGVFDWLGLRTGLPVLIWLTALLGCFALVGVAVQQVATVLTGGPLYWPIAAGAALPVAGIANRFLSGGLSRIMPEYESTVIHTDDLIMRRGVVLDGVARRGHPARAKVVDQHGQAHYVMVEPHHDGDIVAQGETALLVRRAGGLFYIQPDQNGPFRTL